MTGNRGWMRGLGEGLQRGEVAVACSFLGRSKRCGRTCRFHAAKRLGPDFDLPRDFVPRPRAVVPRQTSACLSRSFEQQQWLETEIKTKMGSFNTNFYFRLSCYRIVSYDKQSNLILNLISHSKQKKKKKNSSYRYF